ncbi:MAG: 50S ribosomal protein L6 [Alphaproteobacteria bacterium]|nr:MAG: 50S ribosomal protein L6 [Alphaproteobacteria bacterium]
MSRVGKKPLPVPNGVEVSINGREISVKGAKGNLVTQIPAEIKATMGTEEGKPVVTFEPTGNPRQLSAAWGTSRALVNNMIVGVTTGYNISLKLIGVGYRATVQGAQLNMTLGYSHPIEIKIPAGITVEVKDQTEVSVSGSDKQKVGEFAANIRSRRAPEPFKGKGVRYTNEFITMKEGKKK